MLFEEVKLAAKLQKLPHLHQVAFAASCCERLIPNYHAFFLMEGWGNSTVLAESMDVVWRILGGGHPEEPYVRDLMSVCESIAPDTEQFTSLFTGAALNAAAATLYTLECILNEDHSRPALVARLAIETVDMYLNIIGDPDVDAHSPTITLDY